MVRPNSRHSQAPATQAEPPSPSTEMDPITVPQEARVRQRQTGLTALPTHTEEENQSPRPRPRTSGKLGAVASMLTKPKSDRGTIKRKRKGKKRVQSQSTNADAVDSEIINSQ